MRIGILECGRPAPDVANTHGTYPDMFAGLLAGHGFSFRAYHVEGMEFPDRVDEQDGWLITGSKHGVYEDHAFIAPLEQLVRQAYAQAVPMVGICFGHQIIAQALGGHVEKFSGGWAIGRTAYRIDDQTLHLNAWHQDQVIRRPADATVIGQSEFCEHAALIYGKRAFTVQPHPEFKSDIIASMAAQRKGTLDYPDHIMDRAIAAADAPDDNARLAARIAGFLLSAREVAHA